MSSDAYELRKLVKELQNASTDEDIKGILDILKRDFRVTEPILRESKAGLAVGKLRSHGTKEVADLAKDLVKKWKTEVERAKLQPVQPVPRQPVQPKSKAPPAKADSRNAKVDGVKADFTGDSTRDRCTEILYDALASDSGAPIDLILPRARAIESAVWKENGGTTPAYRSRIRTLYVNLKDKNNPTLREGVVNGDLPVERFCKMTSQEMASEERRAADAKIKEENLYNSLGAEEQQAETDAFQCGRCKQRKCRYRQAQTRSADEPMTTYVTCTNCGNRWKFS